jgi:adenylyl-sulfate kinase
MGDDSAARRRSPNVTWQPGAIDREQRWGSLGHAGATVWMTGLPGSGKSTVAAELEARLVEAGRPAYVLDGDNLRHGLCGDLGFDEAGRCENARRTAEVARLLADSGTVAIVSLVSPYAADRRRARALHDVAGLPFIEVWVSTPISDCEKRDPKGLYARARRGELHDLTGVDAPYEPPANPELEVGPKLNIKAAVQALLGLLEAAEYRRWQDAMTPRAG